MQRNSNRKGGGTQTKHAMVEAQTLGEIAIQNYIYITYINISNILDIINYLELSFLHFTFRFCVIALSLPRHTYSIILIRSETHHNGGNTKHKTQNTKRKTQNQNTKRKTRNTKPKHKTQNTKYKTK